MINLPKIFSFFFPTHIHTIIRGGKVSMTSALQSPESISELVVIDIPPVYFGYVVLGFGKYTEAFEAIERERPDRLAAADKILERYEQNKGVRQFLLTNLRRNEDIRSYTVKANYHALGNSLENLAGFDTKGTFEKPTLFITGSNSPYKSQFLDHHDEIVRLFPNSKLETIENANHWGKLLLIFVLFGKTCPLGIWNSAKRKSVFSNPS